jgi:hypothetical protein
MPTGGGGTRPADAGPATCSCSGGHPPAPAVSAVRTPAVRTPALWTATAVPGAAADSQGVRGVRFRCHPDTGRGVRLRQDGGGSAAAVAAPRQDRRMLGLLVCAGQLARSTQPGENGCPDGWTPDAACRPPGAGTPRHRGHPRPPQGMGTLRQRPRWTAGSRTVHHPAAMPDQNGTPMCGTGQHAPAERQIRSLGAAGNLASSWKDSAG